MRQIVAVRASGIRNPMNSGLQVASASAQFDKRSGSMKEAIAAAARQACGWTGRYAAALNEGRRVSIDSDRYSILGIFNWKIVPRSMRL